MQKVQYLPGGGSDSRNSVLGSNLGFIDGHLREVSSVLIPLQRVSGHGGDINLSTKIARKIAKVCALFNDRASAGGKRSSVRTTLKNV